MSEGMETEAGTGGVVPEARMGPEAIARKPNSEDEQRELGRARLEYLRALQSLTESGGKTTVMIRDASDPLYADSVCAFAADGSTCVVRKLSTALGEVNAAVIRTKDLVYLSSSMQAGNQSKPNKPCPSVDKLDKT